MDTLVNINKGSYIHLYSWVLLGSHPTSIHPSTIMSSNVLSLSLTPAPAQANTAPSMALMNPAENETLTEDAVGDEYEEYSSTSAPMTASPQTPSQSSGPEATPVTASRRRYLSGGRRYHGQKLPPRSDRDRVGQLPASFLEAASQLIVKATAEATAAAVAAVTRTNQPAGRPVPPPAFSGSEGENVSSFLRRLERYLVDIGEHPRDWVVRAESYLFGPALTMYECTFAGYERSWLDFKTSMEQTYGQVTDPIVDWTTLSRMRQTGSVEDFVKDFTSILARNPSFRTSTIHLTFIDGLTNHIKAHVLRTKPGTLEAAIAVARQEESVLRVTREHQQPKPQQPKALPQTQQPSGQPRGKPSPQAPQAPTQANSNVGPQKATMGLTITSAAPTTSVSSIDTCAAPAIPASVPLVTTPVNATPAEPIKVERTERSLLYVPAIIRGKDVEAAVDSGATSSAIRDDLARELGLNLSAHQTHVTGYGSSSIESFSTPEVVSILGRNYEIELVVSDRIPCKFLLGLDWIETSGAYVDGNSKTVSLPPEATPRKPETDVDEHKKQEPLDYSEFKELCSGAPVLTLDQMSDQEQDLVRKRMASWNALWRGDRSLKVPAKVDPIEINLVENARPLRFAPARHSPAQKGVITSAIKEMLADGVVRESKGEWATPVVLAPKPGGKWRVCCDFRPLNTVTRSESFPIPRPEDVLDRLAKSKWFTTLDLTSGYYQVPIAEEHKKYLGIITDDGVYEFNRLPFGIKNAPAGFSRIMRKIFGELEGVETYIDDLTIHGETLEELLDRQDRVLKKVQEFGLHLNLTKCHWAQKSVRVLGFIISNGTREIDPDDLRPVTEFPIPRNVSDVRRFLGMVNHFRRYIPHLAEKTRPLNLLLRKNATWRWATPQQEAFDVLKTTLSSNPVTSLAQADKPFILTTDASKHVAAAILTQPDVDGGERVIAYWSKTFKGAEANYSVTEKECLAVVHAIDHFRHYLIGRPFKVVTDHSALTSMPTIKDSYGRLARWAMFLGQFDFEIVHRSGVSIPHVDALSRAHSDVLMPLVITPDVDPFTIVGLVDYIKTRNMPSGLSAGKVTKILSKAPNFRWDEVANRLYRLVAGGEMWIPEPNLRAEVTETIHREGHFGREKTYQSLKDKAWWPGMRKDVETTIRNCTTCSCSTKEGEVYHQLEHPKTSGLFQRVGMDLLTNLPVTSRGNKGVIVFVDYLSRFPVVMPIQTKTAVEVAQKLLEFISMFGTPQEIISDQGTEWCNKVVEQLLQKCCIDRRLTSTFHPRSNGLVERFNRTLIQGLKKLSGEEPRDWDLWLPAFCMAYRANVQASTKLSPYEVVFGTPMPTFTFWKDQEIPDSAEGIMVRTREIWDALKLQTIAEKHLKFAEARADRVFEKKITDVARLPLQTRVAIRNVHKMSKLDREWLGPYTVTNHTTNGLYILSNDHGVQLPKPFPADHIKKV